MIRIELSPLDFYGLGSIVSQDGDLSPGQEIQNALWARVGLENSVYRSLVFEIDSRLDALIVEELVNVIASRISSALARVEETWIGISPPHLLEASREVRASMKTTVNALEDDAVRFEFRSAGRSIPIAVYFIPHEVGHV